MLSFSSNRTHEGVNVARWHTVQGGKKEKIYFLFLTDAERKQYKTLVLYCYTTDTKPVVAKLAAEWVDARAIEVQVVRAARIGVRHRRPVVAARPSVVQRTGVHVATANKV